MTRLLVLMVALLGPLSAVAKEAFDVTRFVPPPRWQKSQTPALLSLQAPARPGSGAQIFVFPSEAARASPEESFRAAWRTLIATPLGGLAPASVRTETTSEGWIAVMGSAPYARQGGTWRALLVTATGQGRTINVVAHVLGTEHDAEIDAFFRDLDLVAGPGDAAGAQTAPSGPGVAAGAPAASGSAGGVELTPPRDWKRTPRADAVAWVSPPYPNTNEVCELVVLPLRRGGGDLMREAVRTFQALFKVDPMGGYPGVPPRLVRGTSPFGWPYVTIHKSLGPGGEETAGIILLVAGLGDQVATVFTVSKPPLTSQCFGEAFPSQWPAVFHSLQFKGWTPKVADAEMKKKLAGSWTTFAAHAVDNIVLATNGRFANGAALGNATLVSPTTVLWTMNTFRGNGAWSVKGARLVLTPDSGSSGASEGGPFRLEEESQDGRTWKERLCILGRYGDICYRRDQT